MNIRPRTPDDDEAIAEVTRSAFTAGPRGHAGEAELVEALRRDGDAAIELVAEMDGRVVGHVMLSTMRDPTGALGLGPLSTSPEAWRRGIGSMLMDAAIARATGYGATMIFLLGNPDFYRRFGFASETAAAFDSAYDPPYFQALRLTKDAPRSGRARYARAFGED
ncbi:hypothetical protein B5C34_01305 [Pacificimonas flava]|uniref:N-acetyltransferase domain-containing protein n=2 Tax=Pacificimonas TaxID=1960290 RepID=A0A219B320_9SPHN|nr:MULTISPECIES: N-acetyltransferase [Pacificimonas]MBZ6378147.1 N-acetyltransferase [Pacificimonas aurantium]OWV32219.1 hypothetical protein B5C34_01305 [Pacificimonas flava]